MVVGVMISVGFLAIAGATNETADTRLENETHTLSTSQNVTLDKASEWYRMVENETVVDADNGTEYTRGDDYTIDYENGTLEPVVGSLANGEDVYVTYYWQHLDDRTATIVAVLSWGEAVAPLLFLLVCMGAMFALIGEW